MPKRKQPREPRREKHVRGMIKWFTDEKGFGFIEQEGVVKPSIREGHGPSLGQAPLCLYFDLSEFSGHDIARMIGKLSDLYRKVGGDGLVIEHIAFLPEPVLMPQGV